MSVNAASPQAWRKTRRRRSIVVTSLEEGDSFFCDQVDESVLAGKPTGPGTRIE